MNPYMTQENDSQPHRITRSCSNHFTETGNILPWCISVIARMDKFIHDPVNNHISSGKELSIIQTTPTLKYTYLLGAFIINAFREGGRGRFGNKIMLMHQHGRNIYNVYCIQIKFYRNIINPYMTQEIIHDTRGIPDHVLIISQKLAIFLLFIFLEFIGYGQHGRIRPCIKMVITFIIWH